MDKLSYSELQEISDMIYTAEDLHALRGHIDALIRRTAATANQREELMAWHAATNALVRELIRLQRARLDAFLTAQQLRYPLGDLSGRPST